MITLFPSSRLGARWINKALKVTQLFDLHHFCTYLQITFPFIWSVLSRLSCKYTLKLLSLLHLFVVVPSVFFLLSLSCVVAIAIYAAQTQLSQSSLSFNSQSSFERRLRDTNFQRNRLVLILFWNSAQKWSMTPKH